MPSANELAALLARAAASGVGASRKKAGTADEALGLVVTAIRDTILPRTLSIQTDFGAGLRAEVSGGHLLTLLEVQGSAPKDLIGRPLRGTDINDVSEVAELLEKILAAEGQISIVTGLLSAPPDPVQTGISAAQLLTELNLAPFATAVPDALAYFQEAASEVLLALHAPDQPGKSLQDGFTTPPAVAGAIAQLLSDGDGVFGEIGQDEILFLAPCAETQVSIALTRDGDAPLALVLDADGLTDLAAYWSGMVHGIVRLDP